MNKPCSRCREVKALDLYNRNRRAKDGRSSECKACHKARTQTPEARRRKAVTARRYNEKHRAENAVRSRLWRTPERAKVQRSRIDPYARRARSNLLYAVRTGKIARPDRCSRCGWVCTPHGHHPDYAKPLEVVWLCRVCHGIEHSPVQGSFHRLGRKEISCMQDTKP